MATSHGRTIEQPTQEPNQLEQQGTSQTDFDQARRPDYTVLELEDDHTHAQGEDGQGSQMVKEDAPANDLRPPPEIANKVDRDAFNDKWTAEKDAADKRFEERYADWLEFHDSVQEQENEHDLDRDNGLELSR